MTLHPIGVIRDVITKKNPVELVGGEIFLRLTRSVVEDIFQCLNIHVAVELREISREFD